LKLAVKLDKHGRGKVRVFPADQLAQVDRRVRLEPASTCDQPSRAPGQTTLTGDGANERASRPQHAPDLEEEFTDRMQMLERKEAEDHVEGSIRKGQSCMPIRHKVLVVGDSCLFEPRRRSIQEILADVSEGVSRRYATPLVHVRQIARSDFKDVTPVEVDLLHHAIARSVDDGADGAPAQRVIRGRHQALPFAPVGVREVGNDAVAFTISEQDPRERPRQMAGDDRIAMQHRGRVEMNEVA
jgi:hypothetical protein